MTWSWTRTGAARHCPSGGEGRLVREHIAGRDAVYLRDMHDAEAYLAEMLGYMAERNYE